MELVEVTRKLHFCAGHRYWRSDWSAEKNKAVFGACANENGHGHNYTLEVTVAGEVDPGTGMVINLSELDRIVARKVIERVDHRNLNTDIPELTGKIPTTEVLAGFVWQQLDGAVPGATLTRVRVCESDDLWAECSRAAGS